MTLSSPFIHNFGCSMNRVKNAFLGMDARMPLAYGCARATGVFERFVLNQKMSKFVVSPAMSTSLVRVLILLSVNRWFMDNPY